MRGGRTWIALLACALGALAGTPTTALAATPAPAVRKPLPPVVSTVDHPPVDGVHSFDNGPRGAPRVALTFDADMTVGMLAQLQRGSVASWYNREVVEALRQAGAPATIFLTGLWAQTYPEEARSIASDPLFEIGSHTMDHSAFRTPCYGLFPAQDRVGELRSAQVAIAGITGITPRLVRFPGDCYDGRDVATATENGLTVISGDVRGGDGFNQSSASIVRAVLNQSRGGSIVLLHLHGGPNAPMTAPALREIIPGLRGAGFQLVTVSDLLGQARAVRSPPPSPAEPPAMPSGATTDASDRLPETAFDEGVPWLHRGYF